MDAAYILTKHVALFVYILVCINWAWLLLNDPNSQQVITEKILYTE